MSIFQPYQAFSDWLVYDFLKISKNTLLGSSLDFFIFDCLKIFTLIFVLIFLVAMLRTYIPTDKIKKTLTHKRIYFGNILASLLGIVTPFCTCSAIPMFLSFLEAGIPLGITFSFLIASPLINEVALILLLGMFGWKIAVLYIFCGLLISVFAGLLLGNLNLQKMLISISLTKDQKCVCSHKKIKYTFKKRLSYSKNYTLTILKKIWIYIFIGIGIGAWIHGYVPQDFLAKYASSGKWYSVPLAVIIGMPLYSNAAGVIPLVSTLVEKGLGMGTVLAFMMSVTGLSLPEFLILKRIMKLKLLFIFASIVGVGIILVGYIFNLLLG
ncbi:MAG: permease [Parachlamydiales bacterium]|nr:permease [Parachlamydiales bacterium]